MGTLGIGLKSDEETSDNSTYDNFVFNLKKQGFINKAGYSLYLPQKEKKSGTILFGGIDEDKYSGNLTKFIVSSDKLTVPLQSVSFEKIIKTILMQLLTLDPHFHTCPLISLMVYQIY